MLSVPQSQCDIRGLVLSLCVVVVGGGGRNKFPSHRPVGRTRNRRTENTRHVTSICGRFRKAKLACRREHRRKNSGEAPTVTSYCSSCFAVCQECEEFCNVLGSQDTLAFRTRKVLGVFAHTRS